MISYVRQLGKCLKFILPALLNGTLLVLYDYGAYLYERNARFVQRDFLLYIDGREEYHFGIGSCALLFTLILFLVLVIWVLATAKKVSGQVAVSAYKTVNLILISAISILGIVYFVDWYNLSYVWTFLEHKMHP